MRIIKGLAYYIILKEKKRGFDIEKVYVPFNKNSLLSSIYSSDMPEKQDTWLFKIIRKSMEMFFLCRYLSFIDQY